MDWLFQESEDARKGLHGKLALSRRLVVRYATAKAQVKLLLLCPSSDFINVWFNLV